MAVENIKAMLAHKYNPDKADYPAYIQQNLMAYVVYLLPKARSLAPESSS